jgi:hypothetical protein
VATDIGAGNMNTADNLSGLVPATARSNIDAQAGMNVIVLEADTTGAVDASAAFNTAVDLAGVNGNSIFVPKGIYRGSSALKLRTGLNIRGAGSNASIFVMDDGIDGTTRIASETRSFRVKISDIGFHGKTTAYANSLINFDEIDDSSLQNVFLYQAPAAGGHGVKNTGSIGSTRNLFFNVHISNCESSVNLVAGSVSNSARIIGGRMEQFKYGVIVGGGGGTNNISVDGCVFESTLTSAVGIYNAGKKLAVDNCRFEFGHVGSKAVEVTTAARNMFFGNGNYISTVGSRVVVPAGYDLYHEIFDDLYPSNPLPSARGNFSVAGGVVTLNGNVGVFSVARTVAGEYPVVFSIAKSNNEYLVFASAESFGLFSGPFSASVTNKTTTGFTIYTGGDETAIKEARNVDFMVIGR